MHINEALMQIRSSRVPATAKKTMPIRDTKCTSLTHMPNSGVVRPYNYAPARISPTVAVILDSSFAFGIGGMLNTEMRLGHFLSVAVAVVHI
jgi:hypothetical protein